MIKINEKEVTVYIIKDFEKKVFKLPQCIENMEIPWLMSSSESGQYSTSTVEFKSIYGIENVGIAINPALDANGRLDAFINGAVDLWGEMERIREEWHVAKNKLEKLQEVLK